MRASEGDLAETFRHICVASGQPFDIVLDLNQHHPPTLLKALLGLVRSNKSTILRDAFKHSRKPLDRQSHIHLDFFGGASSASHSLSLQTLAKHIPPITALDALLNLRPIISQYPTTQESCKQNLGFTSFSQTHTLQKGPQRYVLVGSQRLSIISTLEMVSRKSHPKSRNGCANCKKRRIKVRLPHPSEYQSWAVYLRHKHTHN